MPDYADKSCHSHLDLEDGLASPRSWTHSSENSAQDLPPTAEFKIPIFKYITANVSDATLASNKIDETTNIISYDPLSQGIHHH
jgi:hypothetical protein